MELCKMWLLTLVVLAALSTAMVNARPHGQRAVQELTDMASNMAHTLDEVVGMLSNGRSRSRRRRMVQFHIGRQHHHPRHRFRRGRRYRKQRASRNPNISDH